jgi:predicted RNase H-like HicB family nuclease
MKSTTKVAQGKFNVILREEEEGGYSVQCVELPGAISQGETREEALRNIKEAIQGYLEAFPEEKERLQLKTKVIQVSI